MRIETATTSTEIAHCLEHLQRPTTKGRDSIVASTKCTIWRAPSPTADGL
jgi:hypothetical protein